MRSLALAALLIAQGMPVTRLSGGVSGEPGAPVGAEPRSPQGMPVTHLAPATAAATLDSPRRLSLTFAGPRPILEVLGLVVAGTPFSLSIDPDVTGTFRGELKQLTLRDALTTLLGPLDAGFEVRGTVLRITRNRMETRAFDVDLLAVQRGLVRTTGGPGAAITTSLPADDVFAAVGNGVQALLSPSGTLHVDRRAGIVQVTDYPARLDRVAQYLEAVQVRSRRQVRLQARVLDVTLSDAAAIDWRAVRERLGIAADAPQAGLPADPAALQAALASQGEVRVLSAPEVTALNNEPALVRAAISEESTLTLSVVPQIAADGVVQLSVSHSWEQRMDNAHDVRMAEADTVTRVMDGGTVLIAGLLRPTEIAVPARGVDSPFGARQNRTAQAELVVLLRATVVTVGTR